MQQRKFRSNPHFDCRYAAYGFVGRVRVPADQGCRHVSNNSTQDLTAVATWSSSNTSVATVAGGAAKGLVANATAVTITATVNKVPGTAALTVTAPVLQSIAVAPVNAAVPVGTFTQFAATGSYSDGSRI